MAVRALLHIATAAASLIPFARAFPDRAGTCVGGKAAVAGYHTSTDKAVKSGPIAALFEITLNGSPFTPDKPFIAEMCTDYELTIQITSPSQRRVWMNDPLDTKQTSYQGLFLRIETADGSDASTALLPGDNLQHEEACDESSVAGVSHFNPRAKIASKATLRFDVPTTVSLDLTITTRNSVDTSVYYYSNYTVIFASDTVNDDAILYTDAPSLASTGSKVPSLSTPTLGSMAPSLSATRASDVPSDVPSDAPSVVPTVNEELTAAPTAVADSCTGAEADTLKTCLYTALQDGDACDSCVALALQDLQLEATCAAYEEGLCAAIASCPCGACREDIEDFINCSVAPKNKCPVSCNLQTLSVAPSLAATLTLIPYPTVAPTHAPTTTAFCAAAQDNLAQCLETKLTMVDGEECDRCVASAISNSTAGCDYLEHAVCSAFETCSCEPCTDEVTVYLNCEVGLATGCTFGDCPGLATPTIAPVATSVAPANNMLLPSSIQPAGEATCKGAQRDLIQCFQTLVDSASCDACVAKAIPKSAPRCDELETLVCEAITDCPCGECSSDVEHFIACTFEPAVGCSFSCD
ncbi:hypothetical protein MPSEU_000779000 [Mayamaea pseudoterrestris]|nr:hypothetical protein MPSEU_000779000 [Mayamaea pseudoterrestris]